MSILAFLDKKDMEELMLLQVLMFPIEKKKLSSRASYIRVPEVVNQVVQRLKKEEKIG